MWLVNDKDRLCGGYHINRLARAEGIQFHVDATGIFSASSKRLCVDYHHVHVRVAGKLVNFRQLLRVVDERLNALAVLCCKVFAHDFKRATYTFTYGNARHHNDKLAPAVEFVQLIHRLDISIGLARSCLHFNGQAQVCGIYCFRRAQLCRHLYLTDAFQYLPGRNNKWLVAEAYNIKEVL